MKNFFAPVLICSAEHCFQVCTAYAATRPPILWLLNMVRLKISTVCNKMCCVHNYFSTLGSYPWDAAALCSTLCNTKTIAHSYCKSLDCIALIYSSLVPNKLEYLATAAMKVFLTVLECGVLGGVTKFVSTKSHPRWEIVFFDQFLIN